MSIEQDVIEIIKVTEQVVQLIVLNKFHELDSLINKESGYSEQFMDWIREDGSVLVTPPKEAFNNVLYHFSDEREWSVTPPFPVGETDHVLRIWEVGNPKDRTWSVDFDMWVAGEGRSEFTLQFTLRELGDNKFEITLHSLHVM